MKQKLTRILLLAPFLFFFSCETEEIIPVETTYEEVIGIPVGEWGEVSEGEGTISCILNGEEWIASSCTGSYVVDDDVALNQLSVTGILGDFMLNLGMKGTYGSPGLELGAYEGEGISDDGFVILNESMAIVGSAPGLAGYALITLTEFDLIGQVCSGTFEFSADAAETPGEIGFEATDGVFEDVPFTIIP